MGAVITKDLAERIVKKLKAEIDAKPGRPHDLALVWVEEKMVASFGLRRGSKKDAPHDHVPNDLYVSPRDARLLGQCPLSREEWIEKLRAKGVIEPAAK